ILAVVVLYWKKFLQSIRFYLVLIVGFIPAALIGFLLNDKIDEWLERVDVVGWMLIAGGVVLIFIDNFFTKTENAENTEVSFLQSFKIGFFQCIALVPGVSRSAATIIGGLIQGLNKKTAAEFSFFLAVPTMAAATGYKLLKFYLDGFSFGSREIGLLAVGNAVAFIVAALAIRSFIGFLTSHGFKLFGYYRIVIGVVILLLYYLGAATVIL
ncbi:MAG TPA: undecaprenyl-diphosphate phosphatase, partial [Cyclobacteriaceae bacterium]|nr:undecaprenyl-diphosphate phosphatase [Cyclobacteriaceae bacterium]